MSLDVSLRREWKGFSLDVRFRQKGGILGILGASGCGKSMTLKCIAGVESPREGRIVAGDRVLFDAEKKINVRPQQRRIGYLFQNYALFPHMTVEGNIRCALGHVPKGEQGDKVNALLARFRLEGMGQRYPHQLSGGQQQRVALARILAYEPEALLLDEPFSALDSHLKEQLQLELLELLRDYHGDVVLVTHSRDEVYRLCDTLMVMQDGRCLASGGTREMFRRPELLTVARLTGCKNYSRARAVGENRVFAQDWGAELTVRGPIPDGMDCVGVRAHHFVPATADAPNAFPVASRERLESPFEWNILFAPTGGPPGTSVWWMVSKTAYTGEIPIYLSAAPEDILLLRSGGQAIE